MKVMEYNGYRIVDAGYGFVIEDQNRNFTAEFDTITEAQEYVDSIVSYDEEANVEIPDEFNDIDIRKLESDTGLKFAEYGHHTYREISGKSFDKINESINMYNKKNKTNIFCYDDPFKFCTFIKF